MINHEIFNDFDKKNYKFVVGLELMLVLKWILTPLACRSMAWGINRAISPELVDNITRSQISHVQDQYSEDHKGFSFDSESDARHKNLRSKSVGM